MVGAIGAAIPVAAAGGSLPGLDSVIMSVSHCGVTESVCKGGIGGTFLSSEASGSTAIGLVVRADEIEAGEACSAGLVGRSIAVLIAGNSRTLLEIDGFGASTSAGRRT